MVEPNISQKTPYEVSLKPGKHLWCGCGLSKTEPLCDGAHKGTELPKAGFGPKVVKIEEETTVHLCGCKHTKTPPMCDGSHKDL